jgi:hypothetical protein
MTGLSVNPRDVWYPSDRVSRPPHQWRLLPVTPDTPVTPVTSQEGKLRSPSNGGIIIINQ